MKPGRYKAFVVDKIISENKQGNPQAVVQVEVDLGNGEKQAMNYYGSFKDGALEHTLKALVACGIKGNSPTDPITKGIEVSVVIVEEEDNEGKPRTKVAWINKPFGLGDAIDLGKAKAALSKYDGALAALRAKEPKPKNFADNLPSYDNNEEIPF
jgi:hypothetical protein